MKDTDGNNKMKRRPYRFTFHPVIHKAAIEMLDGCAKTMRSERVAEGLQVLREKSLGTSLETLDGNGGNNKMKRRAYRLTFHPEIHKEVIETLDGCSMTMRNEKVAEGLRVLREKSLGTSLENSVRENKIEVPKDECSNNAGTITDLFNKGSLF